MSKAHAILSPSGAARWLACTPSARLEKQFPDRAGEAAREGTVAHSLGELILRKETKEINEVKYKRKLATIEKNDLYSPAMWGYADDYATFVLERFAEAKAATKDAILEIEVRLDLTDLIPEGFGTGDAIIIADGVLDLIDLKYGKGVEVDATENKQMMVYALGALRKYSFLYKIDRVRMTIFQPRINNFSSWEISVDGLETWAENVLVPGAKLAFDGKGEFKAGPHCLFCKAKPVCKTHADYQLEIAKYDFKDPHLLDDDAVSDIMDRAKDFTSWIKSVNEFALHVAINDGKKWPGYKLVAGRSNRAITDEKAAVAKLKSLNVKPSEIYTKKLNGVTAFEKLLGKKVFADELGPFVVKPDGKPTLVPDFDKRPELGSAETAKSDFENAEI